MSLLALMLGVYSLVIFGLPDVFFILEVGSMDDCVMIVDDGFFKLVKKHFHGKLLKSFRNICNNEGFVLKHLFFCTAPPYQNKVPDEKEASLKRDYDKLISLLNYKKWITVREGRCQRLEADGEFNYFQKGVDSWVVFEMSRLKLNFPNVKKVILISSDSDFAPIINEVQEKDNIEIILYTYFDRIRGSPFSSSNHLLQSCSRWVKLKSEDFK